MKLASPFRVSMVPGQVAVGGWWCANLIPHHGVAWARMVRENHFPHRAVHVFPQLFHQVPDQDKVRVIWYDGEHYDESYGVRTVMLDD